MINTRYIIISPVRNEEDYIEKTIESVVNQSILPVEWIIVNDGSDDSTPQILNSFSEKYSWIKVTDRPQKGHRPGLGVVLAFNHGFNLIDSNNFDFIIKLDGDLSFDKDYFEFLINEFDKNPKLGMASGTTYNLKGHKFVIDKMPEDHVRGAAKMYRKKCFEEIGGLQKVLGWDTIDELKAQMTGCETRSYKDLKIIHYKPIGFKQKATVKREMIAGERMHYLGYHPLFSILKCLYNFKRKPYIIGGLLMLIGYFDAIFRNKPRIPDNEMIAYLRKKQLKRLL